MENLYNILHSNVCPEVLVEPYTRSQQKALIIEGSVQKWGPRGNEVPHCDVIVFSGGNWLEENAWRM